MSEDSVPPGGFVRHCGHRSSGTSNSEGPSRWSFGRCSVRSLATLLRRGSKQQPQKQQQLSSLSNDLNIGNHGRLDAEPSKPVKSATAQCLAEPVEVTDLAMKPPRIRTTVLGCPRKLRASMPVRVPPVTSGKLQDELQVAATASPLFQVKRAAKKQPPAAQHQCQLHQRTSHQQTLESIPDDEDGVRPASLLLELDRELRQVALVGWRRSLTSLSDVWSLFASQWPAQMHALGSDWQVSVLRPEAGRWETLRQDAAATGVPQPLFLPHGSHLRLDSGSGAQQCHCSCACTCRSFSGGGEGGSQQRIERLEAEVTSLSRRLLSAAPPTTPAKQATPPSPIDGQRLRALRDECRKLRASRDAMRRDHERRVCETRQMISDLSNNVRRVLGAVASASPSSGVSSAEASQRRLMESELQAYQLERAEVSNLIEDIDETTGELRQDVLRRRCRSNPAEVELLALHLSRATQRLASLKNRFPAVQARTRDLLLREAATAAGDERVLSEEADRLDGWLRRVKRLTMMLYTFKQLAEAQAKEPPSLLPMTAVPESSGVEARRDLLRGVLSVCPDHERRARAIERAEVAIERRRRMVREAAALKAEKTLTAAASRLKPVPALTATVVATNKGSGTKPTESKSR